MLWLNGLWAGIACLAFGAPVLAAEPFAWNVPSVRWRVEVPATLEAVGVPVRLEQVNSAEKPDALAKHFVGVFDKAGLYIAPERHQRRIKGGFALTALDVQRLVSYTVMLRPLGDGSTEVLLGEAHLGQKRKPAGGEIAPVFPGATEVITSDVEMARMVVYATRASKDEVGAFYRETLGKAGYVETESGVFANGSEELRVLLRDQRGKRRVVVVRRVGTAESVHPSLE